MHDCHNHEDNRQEEHHHEDNHQEENHREEHHHESESNAQKNPSFASIQSFLVFNKVNSR